MILLDQSIMALTWHQRWNGMVLVVGNNYGWRMVDTERGATKAHSRMTSAGVFESSGLTAFTSTGLTPGTRWLQWKWI